MVERLSLITTHVNVIATDQAQMLKRAEYHMRMMHAVVPLCCNKA